MSPESEYELSGELAAFNLSAVNYIMERKFHYNGRYDLRGTKLDMKIKESCSLAERIMEHYEHDNRFLDKEPFLPDAIREFYFISETLASFVEPESNENIEFFVCEQLYPRIEKAYDISDHGMARI